MTTVDVVVADGTIPIYSQQLCKAYSCLSFLQAYNSQTKQAIVIKLVMQRHYLVYFLIMV